MRRGVGLLVVLALGTRPGALVAQNESCEPVSQRAGREFGCFITAREELGRLPSDSALYWHIDAYPTHAAARAAKGPRGTVVESLGRNWLFTIAVERWRQPMMLTGTGTRTRRSLVLILQDASKPRSTLATDWKPTGLCTLTPR
jgi:hypothetical protein